MQNLHTLGGIIMRNECYDTALICMNGHKINGKYHDLPQLNSNFCKKCGAKTINSCSYCRSEICGYYRGGPFAANYRVPAYCQNCGKPYPWTEEKLKALKETIDQSEISDKEKEEFSKNLPDIISETPRTQTASLKIKNIGAKVGKEIWGVAREILIDIASETAKKSIGLK